jgi:hypothetical protein
MRLQLLLGVLGLSSLVADGLPIAFFPVAEGLPLYHALPAP